MVAGPSGIIDVATGEAVNLVMNGTTVEGRSATTNQLVFTVTVDSSGVVTLDQIRAVQHKDPADPVESGGSAAGLTADDLVKLTATVTDKDGDTATATVNIGSNLHFEDDGPSVSNQGAQPLLIVDETVLATDATQNFAGCIHAELWRRWSGSRSHGLCAWRHRRRQRSGRYGHRPECHPVTQRHGRRRPHRRHQRPGVYGYCRSEMAM